MRKLAIVCLILMMCASTLCAESSDVIVLVDTSESVFSYFDKMVDYIVTHIANDYLLQGDTFHLLTFSETSQLELSQEIVNEDSIKLLVSRLYLLLPFGKRTDILSALSYLDQYVSDLGERNGKHIIIITDGVHNPPPRSPYAGMSQEEVLKEIDATTARLAARGWKISVIRVPFTADSDSADPAADNKNSDSFIDRLSSGLRSPAIVFDPDNPDEVARQSIALPIATYPGDLGKRSESFSFPVKIENTGVTRLHLELREVVSGGMNILDRSAFLNLDPGKSGTLKVRVTCPDSMQNGPQKMDIKLIFAESQRISPVGTTLSFTLSRNPFSSFLRNSRTVILFVILVAVFALIIVIAWTLVRMSGMSSASVVKTVSDAEDEASASARAYPSSARSAAAASAPAALSESALLARKSIQEADKSGKVIPAASAIRLEGKQASAGALADGKRLVTEGYVIPVKLKEKIVVQKAPSHKKLEAERRRAERIASMEAERRESAMLQSLKPKADASIHVQMNIAEQNPNIGLRNVHVMKSGAQLNVGGGSLSDFLVFVVNVPRKVAALYFDGEKLIFLPIRKEYFPELDGPVEDCLGKKIIAVSPEGFRMTITFDIWVNPLEKAQKVLKAF